MKFIIQLHSLIKVLLRLIIEAYKDSSSQIISNLRDFPKTIKAEIVRYNTRNIYAEPLIEDSIEAEEIAVYGYSA